MHSSCLRERPDLKFIEPYVIWTDTEKTIELPFKNVGIDTAKNFMVALDFKEDPVTRYDQPLQTFGPFTQIPGDSDTIRYDALPYARAENHFLNNVTLIYAKVDNRNRVTESDENNNILLYHMTR
jgi:hypothetical protein